MPIEINGRQWWTTEEITQALQDRGLKVSQPMVAKWCRRVRDGVGDTFRHVEQMPGLTGVWLVPLEEFNPATFELPKVGRKWLKPGEAVRVKATGREAVVVCNHRHGTVTVKVGEREYELDYQEIERI